MTTVLSRSVPDALPSGTDSSKPVGFKPSRPFRYGFSVGPLVLLALWSLGSAVGWLEPRVLSAPWKVVETAITMWQSGRLQAHLLASITRAALGLSLGTIVGTLLALFSGLSASGEALLDGPLQIKRSVPNLALIPLLILWFGIGETMKVVTITLGAMIQVYVQTHAGLRQLDVRYVELARTLRLSRWKFIRYVALPGALPHFFIGFRLASTAALITLVVVEQVNATSGVGYMMSLARSYGQTEIIFLGLVIYGLFGLAVENGVRFLERRALSWRRVLAS